MRVAIVGRRGFDLTGKDVVPSHVHAKIAPWDPLLKLRRAIGEIVEALAVAGRQTGDDASYSAERLVNNLSMFFPESFERFSVSGHERLRNIEALGLNQRGLIGFGILVESVN